MPNQLKTYTSKEVFIVAELSANHNGDKAIAIETIKAAKAAGANAIKLQTYTADSMTIKSNQSDFLINHDTVWDGKYLYDLYQEAATPLEWHRELFDVAHNEGLVCFSSPFDCSAVDFLEELGNPIYKIASLEITDIPLIQHIAAKGKPMILSTGIAKSNDIELALETCMEMGNDQIALLKCTSSYPAPMEEANLTMIQDLAQRFKVEVGLSDHTLGITAPVVATTLGARIIEKHFILDKSIGGPDASFSLDKEEFTQMVKAVRETEAALGTIDYQLTEKQLLGRDFARSLYIVKNVKKGEEISPENIRSIRPGHGLHPKHLSSLLGKKFKDNYTMGTRMELSYGV